MNDQTKSDKLRANQIERRTCLETFGGSQTMGHRQELKIVRPRDKDKSINSQKNKILNNFLFLFTIKFKVRRHRS